MIAVKIQNAQVIEIRENVTDLPEGFTELWEQDTWETYQENNQPVAVLLVDGVVQQFLILPFSFSPALPEGFTELWTRFAWNEYVQAAQTTSLVDINAKVQQCFEFGEYLKQLFVADNWRLPIAFTLEMSLSLSVKFADIMALCATGAIKEIGILLPTIAIDEVFTQERKDAYQALVNEFVAQNYPNMT